MSITWELLTYAASRVFEKIGVGYAEKPIRERLIEPSVEKVREWIGSMVGGDAEKIGIPPNHHLENAYLSAWQLTVQMLKQAIEQSEGWDRPRKLSEATPESRDWWERFQALVPASTIPASDANSPQMTDAFQQPLSLSEQLKKFVSQPPLDQRCMALLVDDSTDREFGPLREQAFWTWMRQQLGTVGEPGCLSTIPVVGLSPSVFGLPFLSGDGVRLWSLVQFFFQDHLKHNPLAFAAYVDRMLAKLVAASGVRPLRVEEIAEVVASELKQWQQYAPPFAEQLAEFLNELSEQRKLVEETLDTVRAISATQDGHVALDEQGHAATLARLSELQQDQKTSYANDEKILGKLDEVLVHTSRPDHPAIAAPLKPGIADGLLRAESEAFYGRTKPGNALRKRLVERLDTAVVGPAGFGKTALAVRVILEVCGRTPESVAVSPYPDGVLFLDLYELRGQADQAWNRLANDLCGLEFYEKRAARERAELACQGRRMLVVIEGGEEADGQNGRASISELLGVLKGENRYLLLTREITQTNSTKMIRLDEPLTEREAGQLLDRLTEKRVTGEIRQRILKRLAGHPLGLNWAGGLLARADENPADPLRDWETEPTLTLSDPDPERSRHTLGWLFGRSTRGLKLASRLALSVAGLLAHRQFPDSLVEHVFNELEPTLREKYPNEHEHVENVLHVRSAIKQLVDAGLLRRDKKQPELCEFTHVLGYEFARTEATAADDLRYIPSEKHAGQTSEGVWS